MNNRLARGSILSQRLLVVAALSLAAFWLMWSTNVWYRFHPHIPWRDQFLLLAQLDQLTSISAWLEPHYGAHRIAIPRLLLWLDTHWGAGMNHWYYGAAFMSAAAILVIFYRHARCYFEESAQWLFVTALAVALFFSPAHIWNLSNPINVSWVISLALSLLALTVLLRRDRAPVWRDWLLAFGLTGGAALSTFTGVIAWLLLPLVALVIQPRRAIWILLLSLLLTAWYIQGMSSDAAMATRWDLGSPQLVEEIRQQAQSALAGNTLLHIGEKSLLYLAWPMAADYPFLGLSLSLGSLLIFVLGLVQILRQYQIRKECDHWLIVCLFLSALCLGVAVATQLGRVMVHPNHAHGPSFERYQSIVLVYWFCIAGLSVSLARPWPRWCQNILWTTMLAITLLIQHPQGRYLDEEVASFEYAAWLFSLGESRTADGHAPTIGNRYSPEYVFSFDPIFSAGQLSYHRRVRVPIVPENLSACVGEWSVTMVDTAYPGRHKVLRFEPGFAVSDWARGLLLITKSGQLARLNLRTGEHPAVLGLSGTLAGDWSGPLGSLHSAGHAVLLANLPWGYRPLCQLNVTEQLPASQAAKP